jgi:hypothetical protein
VHAIACSPVFTGGIPQEKKVIAAELGGQHHESIMDANIFLGARQAPMHIVPMHVMYCVLHIGFLDDSDRLHGSTLPYITLSYMYYCLRLDVLCLVDSYR